MSIANDIVDKMIDILKADSRFNGINLFVKGAALNIEARYYPNAEVVITEWVTTGKAMGRVLFRSYSAQVRFFDRYQDILTVVDREASVGSYVSATTLAGDCVALFDEQSNKTLESLSGANYAVLEADADGGEHGFTGRDEKSNNYDNYAVVNVTIKTKEVRSAS